MAPKKLRKVQVQDCLKLIGLSQPSISPDCSSAMFVKNTLSTDGRSREQAVWLIDLLNGKIEKLSDGPRDTEPIWACGSNKLARENAIAFVGPTPENGSPQIYTLPEGSTKTRVLTDTDLNPKNLCFMPASRRISFTAQSKPDARTRKNTQTGADARIYSEPAPNIRIFSACLRSGNVRPESPPEVCVWDYAWLNSQSVAIIHTPTNDESTHFFAPSIGILNTAEGTVRDLNVKLQFATDLAPSPNGQYIAARANDRSVPFGYEAWVIDVETGAASNLTPDLKGNVVALKWMQDSASLLLHINEGVSSALYIVSFDAPGELRRVCEELPAVITSIDLCAECQTVLCVAEASDRPPAIWRADLTTGTVTQVTKFNAFVSGLRIGRTRIIKWKSSDDFDIEGIVTLPPGYSRRRTYPTILFVHGGPWGVHSRELRLWPRQLFASAGYVVLSVNYRGSSAYGLDFQMANQADWMGGDYRDHIDGLEVLINDGIADPDRLGIYGGSYGGYTTMWAVTQTDMFKAAVSHAGIADVFALCTMSDEGPLLSVYFDAQQFDDPEAYRACSPLTFAANAKTPILLTHGDNDTVVHPSQSLQMALAMQHFGVEHELVTYPREGHGIHEPQHLLDWYTRIITWFDNHMK